MKALKRIAITGPESTGKSWLASALALHFNDIWAPEFSRSYLESLNRPYHFDDIEKIAQGQIEAENALASKAKSWLFCDTDVLVNYVWSSYKYGKSTQWIENMLKHHTYTHTLLCSTDLPWQFDPLREHPLQRDELFDLYLSLLQKSGVSFSIVSGSGDERLQCALNAISNLD